MLLLLLCAAVLLLLGTCGPDPDATALLWC
jgi:hypothetical protein